MADRPDGARLLELARRVLLEEVLPAAGEGRRYDVLMIANAMAIAGRELAQAAAGAAPPDGAAAALAAQIRAGRHDASLEIHGRLLAEVTARLRLSNPKTLRD